MKMVTISEEEYRKFLNNRRLLLALQNAGVDNWEGYDYALAEYRPVEYDHDCDD